MKEGGIFAKSKKLASHLGHALLEMAPRSVRTSENKYDITHSPITTRLESQSTMSIASLWKPPLGHRVAG
jgi:hypothetical protein